jgi:hypothetical protein
VVRGGIVNSQLFEVNNAAAPVSFKAGFFDDVVKTAGPTYPFKDKLWVGLVSGY